MSIAPSFNKARTSFYSPFI